MENLKESIYTGYRRQKRETYHKLMLRFTFLAKDPPPLSLIIDGSVHNLQLVGENSPNLQNKCLHAWAWYADIQ